MKSKWTIVLVLFLAGWIGTHLRRDDPRKAWAAPAVCVDGDVNQDGAFNLTDPVYLLSALFQGGPPPVTCKAAPVPAPVSTVFIVRHGEKANEPADDPPLTQEGMDRAARLADVFKNATVDHLIASTKIRTQQTLEPLARAKGLPVATIGDLSAQSAVDVADRIRSFKPGDVTVVAHHSTTIELIARELGIPRSQTDTIDTSVFDNLIEVLLPSEPGQSPQLVKLAYK